MGEPVTSGLHDKNTAGLDFSDGVWRKGSLIVVPDVGDLRQKCLSLHHDTPFAGHLGRDRTVQLVMRTYWWPGLDKDVRHYVSTCDHCQRNKASNEKPAGLLQPLPVPDFRWQWVTVDFITDLPETKAGHTAIAVFVDRLRYSGSMGFPSSSCPIEISFLPLSSLLQSVTCLALISVCPQLRIHRRTGKLSVLTGP